MLNRIETYAKRMAGVATGLALVLALAPNAGALPIGRVTQDGTVVETSSVADFSTFTNETNFGTNPLLANDAGFFADASFVYKVSQAGEVIQFNSSADLASGGVGTSLGTNGFLGNDRGMFSIAGVYYTVTQAGDVFSFTSGAHMAAGGGTLVGSRGSLANDTGFFASEALGGIFTVNQDGKVIMHANISDFVATGLGVDITGDIAGLANDAGFYAFSVPEPGTVLLLGAGLLGLGVVGRRSRG